MCVDTDGSSFDTLLAVYVKDVTTGTVQREAVSNDQHEPTNSTCEFFVSGKNTTFAKGDTSQIFLSYDAQHEYYFVVDGKQGATGSVQLNWIALATGNTSSAPVIPTISGMTPETACSASSTATDVCGQPGKDLLLHIIGRDFIAGKTRVIVKGFDILGAPGGTIEYLAKPSDPNRDCLYFEKDHPLTGVCSEMIVHVPPRPPLGEIGIDSVRTLTPVDTPASSSAKTSLENLSVGAGGYSGILLPPAKYVIGFGSRALNVVDVQTDVIPPGTEQQVCFGLSDGTLCMDWTNRGSKPATFLPTFFAAYARCLDLDFPEPRGTCENSTLHSTEFAINPQLVFIGETYFTKRVDITPIQAQLIKSTGGTVGFAFEGGVPKLLSPSGGQIVSQGAGNLIGNAGDALIGNAGGTLIGNAGGTLIDNAGGTLLSHDGSGLVSHDGGSLIGQDGTTLVSHDGGSLTPGSILGGSTQDQSLRSSLSIGQGARAQSSQHGDFSQGVGGFFLAQSSGGQDATLTSTTDPVTGEVKTYLQINFDGTSFPRASDLAGMAFTVVVNPALIKVASQNITVNPGASSAAIKVTRTGDKSLPVILDYSTSDATAKADTDYTATSGSVTFAPGETEKTISVPLLGASGASRKFNLVIGNVVGGVLQAPNFTSVTLPQSVPVWEPVALSASQTEIKTWTLGGRTYAYLKLSFPNAGFRVTDWGQAIRTGSDFAANASVEKFSGLSVQAVTTTAGIYDLGPLADGNYTFTFKNSGTVVKTLPFTVSSVVPPPNPIDDARQFVKQQYRDFLNREADQAGEDFWTDNITKCNDPARRPAGQTVEQCTLRQRETTSGAFFLSPEFQYTGYYVLRMYQGALGRQPKLSEFLPDAQFVGNGIVVNGGLSAAKINQNKADYAAQFVNCTDAAKYRCSEFKAIYDALNNTQYVDKLFLTTGVNGSASDRAALVSGLNGGSETRASVLQKVVDGVTVLGEGNQQFTTTYGQAFYDQQFTRAFVQLEYFGYMKRDPDEAGYNFWLGKLNQFGGNFVNAEMVLAFISSPEYRARFGQP
jgi:hypothetical protein